MKALHRITYIVALLLAAQTLLASERERLAFLVVCDDAALQSKLNNGISSRLTQANIEISDKFPQGKLFLYVSHDINDNKNPSGISVAVAHVSNIQTAALALESVKRQEALPDLLTSMLKEQGFLQHLSVAHLDTGSDSQIDLLLNSAVDTFLENYPHSPASG
jgi:hypothetical protein